MTAGGLVCSTCGSKEGGGRRCAYCGGSNWREEDEEPAAAIGSKGDGSKWECPSGTHDTPANGGDGTWSKWCPDCEHALRVKLEAELREARRQLQGQSERTVWAVAEAASTTSRHERSIWERRVREARALADVREMLMVRHAMSCGGGACTVCPLLARTAAPEKETA